MPKPTAGAGYHPVIDLRERRPWNPRILISRPHTLSRLGTSDYVGVFTIKVGRERQKGERIIPFSLPTLYIYYTINLKKNQNLLLKK